MWPFRRSRTAEDYAIRLTGVGAERDRDRDGVDPRDAWASAERKLRGARTGVYRYGSAAWTTGLERNPRWTRILQ